MSWKRNSGAPPAKKSEYSTFIDEGSAIEGKFSFSGNVMLNGKLHGEIVSNDTLIVGEKGVVNANIRAGFVQISGEVTGNVLATERVELCANSRVYGDVDAPVVIIEDGAIFEGHCRMTKSRAPEAALTPSREASVVPLKAPR
jgi:cytoskeletal protein CcmA (bactofilin family)